MPLQAAAKVIFDLASFEIVRRFSTEIWDIINSGNVHAVFGNADEWRALGDGIQAPSTDPTNGTLARDTGALLATHRRVVQHCQLAVTTRGSLGCVAMERSGAQHRCPALALEHVKDPTGAGDLFASGFVHGLLAGASIQDCCRIGCACGAAATQVRRPPARHDQHGGRRLPLLSEACMQVDGAEMTAELWRWVRSRLDGLPVGAPFGSPEVAK